MKLLSSFVVGGFLLAFGIPAAAQIPADSSDKPASEKYLTDVQLQDQTGKTLRLYSDLMKGHTVVIIPFFTSCTAVCPPMNATMRRVQTLLGDRVGKDIVMISISVDPATDTPERLAAYAAKFKAGPGWFFITGKKENLEVALKKLGSYVDDKNEHSPTMSIGNVTTGLWKKIYALSKPDTLVTQIEEVANDKGDQSNRQTSP